MNYEQAKNSLLEVKKLLKDITIGQPFHFDDGVKEISWGNYKPGIPNGQSYVKEYYDLVNSQQYSFLLFDGSFLQFYYEFVENDQLNRSRCAYYPRPSVFCEEVSEGFIEYSQNELAESSLIEMALEDSNIYLTNTSHIRFDFDAKVGAHCKSHLQFGGHNSLRVCSNHIIDPVFFVTSLLSSELSSWHSLPDYNDYKTFIDEAEKFLRGDTLKSYIDETRKTKEYLTEDDLGPIYLTI
jgi:hypothetical protein